MRNFLSIVSFTCILTLFISYFPEAYAIQKSVSLGTSEEFPVNTECPDIVMDETSQTIQDETIIADVVIRTLDQVCVHEAFILDGTESRYPTGHEVKFIWDFDDGTSKRGAKVQKKYDTPGDYHVVLTLEDLTSDQCSMKQEVKLIHVMESPVAEAGEEATVCVGEILGFDGSLSKSETSPDALFASWDFGDGFDEKGIKVRHAYKNPGTYWATLSIEDPMSLRCASSSSKRKVTVKPAPKISLKPEKTELCVGDQATFKAIIDSSDKTISDYFWSFDDGVIIKTGPAVQHHFSKAGRYKVSVAVDDDRGTPCSSDSAFVHIAVFPPEQCPSERLRQ